MEAMENLPQEISRTSSAPQAPRHPKGRKTAPGLVATGGALCAAGLGLSIPWVIVGGIVGYLVGKKAAVGNKESGSGD